MAHSLCMHHIIKQFAQRQASQIDIFTNKLDNSESKTILGVFLLFFILNQSYHQTHIADYLTYIIAKA